MDMAKGRQMDRRRKVFKEESTYANLTEERKSLLIRDMAKVSMHGGILINNFALVAK